NAGVPLPLNANTLPIAGSGLDTNFERFGAADHTFTVAHRTNGSILACPAATRTCHVELHSATGLLDRSLAVALWTNTRLLDVSAAVAIAADLLTRNVEPHHAPADCRPERDVYLIFEITTRFRRVLCCSPSARSPKNALENIAESAATVACLTACA